MCSHLPLPGRADGAVQLGTSCVVIRARFQVQLQWHLNCARILVQFTKQKGTYSLLLTPQNLKMCVYSLAPSTGTLHKLAFICTNESIPVRKATNNFLQIAHLVDMIILLFNNNELLLFL